MGIFHCKMNNKKIKAAIMAVIHLLDEEKREKLPRKNLWAVSGRKIIMDNRTMVQTRMIKSRRQLK